MVAVIKPPGIATIPGPPGEPSLVELLSRQMDERLFVVHRLDREASGVLLFARDAATHRALNLQFEQRAVTKRYAALLHGTPDPLEGSIEAMLRERGSGRISVVLEGGKPCETGYRVQARSQRFALVEAAPTTGRRHQLRVHFYHIGHAIVGDPLYGPSIMQKPFARLCLHATRIEFRLPDGELIQVEDPAWKLPTAELQRDETLLALFPVVHG